MFIDRNTLYTVQQPGVCLLVEIHCTQVQQPGVCLLVEIHCTQVQQPGVCLLVEIHCTHVQQPGVCLLVEIHCTQVQQPGVCLLVEIHCTQLQQPGVCLLIEIHCTQVQQPGVCLLVEMHCTQVQQPGVCLLVEIHTVQQPCVCLLIEIHCTQVQQPGVCLLVEIHCTHMQQPGVCLLVEIHCTQVQQPGVCSALSCNTGAHQAWFCMCTCWKFLIMTHSHIFLKPHKNAGWDAVKDYSQLAMIDNMYDELQYSGKLLREKTFAFFCSFRTICESFLSEILQSAMLTLGVCGCVAHARGPHLHNNWTGAIRKSFIREILVLYRNAKVFSLESFPLYSNFQSLVGYGYMLTLAVSHWVLKD